MWMVGDEKDEILHFINLSKKHEDSVCQASEILFFRQLEIFAWATNCGHLCHLHFGISRNNNA